MKCSRPSRLVWAGLAIFAVGASCRPDERAPPLRVLFIGNSYTAENDLPAIVRAALASAPEVGSIEVESLTPGGATLGDHWMTGLAADRIRNGRFTHVVLQPQSTELVRWGSMARHAGLFAHVVHEAGAKLVLFETWHRREGHELYADPAWPYRCPGAMAGAAEMFYRHLASTLGSELAPIGEAWAHVAATHPEIELYAEDGTHPSLAGSWLAASVLVCALAARSAEGLSAPLPLPAIVATDLARVAEHTCAEVDAVDANAERSVPECPEAGTSD